jgi:hypothetical protein
VLQPAGSAGSASSEFGWSLIQACGSDTNTVASPCTLGIRHIRYRGAIKDSFVSASTVFPQELEKTLNLVGRSATVTRPARRAIRSYGGQARKPSKSYHILA